MKKTAWLPILGFALLSGLPSKASAGTGEIYKTLEEALLCRSKQGSLDAIRGLEAQKRGLLKAGIEFKKRGEEEDEEISLTLKKPLVIHGAKTSRVTAQLSGTLFVSAEFAGDADQLIQKLGLSKGKDGIAEYARPTSSEMCAPTVGLNKLGPGMFALGCGWCNGG